MKSEKKNFLDFNNKYKRNEDSNEVSTPMQGKDLTYSNSVNVKCILINTSWQCLNGIPYRM